MSSNTVNDKTGKPINIGDTVSTRMRGGKRTGEVWHFLSGSFSRRSLPGRDDRLKTCYLTKHTRTFTIAKGIP